MTTRGALRKEVRDKVSLAVRTTYRIDKLAAKDPDAALREAEDIHDPSLRASGLLAVAKRIKRIEPLQDAVDVLLGIPKGEITTTTKNNKLIKISKTAVGIDNRFANETAELVTWPLANRQLKRALSVLMAPSIGQALRGENPDSVADYPDLVIASFFESIGDHSYFWKGFGNLDHLDGIGQLPSLWGNHRLDPITDGELAISALRSRPDHSRRMEFFVAGQVYI